MPLCTVRYTHDAPHISVSRYVFSYRIHFECVSFILRLSAVFDVRPPFTHTGIMGEHTQMCTTTVVDA